MTASDTLAIVVVNYGSSDLLQQHLASTTRALDDVVVVVVDNLTTAEERATLSRLCEDQGWDCLAMQDNVGFGSGMNAGVEMARALGARWFLLLNPDVVIEASAVRALHEHVLAAPDALVAPRLLRPDGTVWSVGTFLYLDDGRMRSAGKPRDASRPTEFWLSGACLLVGDELWDRSGGFAGEYFLYWEDVELCRRATAAGGRLLLVDDVVAEHAAGGTQGVGQTGAGTPKSATYYYYNTRNRLLFAARNLDEPNVRAWMRASVPVGREILLRGGRRQLLRSWQPLLAVWRGTRDGRAIARESLRRRPSTAGPAASGADGR